MATHDPTPFWTICLCIRKPSNKNKRWQEPFSNWIAEAVCRYISHPQPPPSLFPILVEHLPAPLAAPITRVSAQKLLAVISLTVIQCCLLSMLEFIKRFEGRATVGLISSRRFIENNMSEYRRMLTSMCQVMIPHPPATPKKHTTTNASTSIIIWVRKQCSALDFQSLQTWICHIRQCWQPTKMKKMNHPNISFSSKSQGLLGWNLMFMLLLRFCLLVYYMMFCYKFLCFFILGTLSTPH